MPFKFRSHGTFSLEVEDNILIFKCKGPWNIELLSEIKKEMMPYLENLSQDYWGVLLIPMGEAMLTPEAEKQSKIMIQSTQQKKRVCTAIMTNDIDSPRITRAHLKNVYDAANEPVEFFEEIDKAKNWIQENINKKKAHT